MKKTQLTSRSPRRAGSAAGPASTGPEASAAATRAQQATAPELAASPTSAAPPSLPRRQAALWGLGGAAVALAVAAGVLALQPEALVITQADIDRAVRASLEKEPLPSAAAKAYEAILPSVVRVTGLSSEDDEGADDEGDSP